jgi:hypothetical protein
MMTRHRKAQIQNEGRGSSFDLQEDAGLAFTSFRAGTGANFGFGVLFVFGVFLETGPLFLPTLPYSLELLHWPTSLVVHFNRVLRASDVTDDMGFGVFFGWRVTERLHGCEQK